MSEDEKNKAPHWLFVIIFIVLVLLLSPVAGATEGVSDALAVKCAAQSLYPGSYFRRFLKVKGNRVQYRIHRGDVWGTPQSEADTLLVFLYSPRQTRSLLWRVNTAGGRISVFLFPDHLVRIKGGWVVAEGNGGPGQSEKVRGIVEEVQHDPIQMIGIPAANDDLPCNND